MPKINRRDAIKTTLQTIGLVATGQSVLTACAPTMSGGRIKIANLNEFANPGAYKLFEVGKTKYIVIRTNSQQSNGVNSGGIFLSLYDRTCPHIGCVVETPANGAMLCPCHNASFNTETGAMIVGPDLPGLTTLNLEIRDSDLYAVL